MKPIIFEGIDLSPISIALDHLGMYENLPDLPEETSKWLWHFCICRGVTNKEEGKVVQKNISLILSQVITHREHLLENVPIHFDGEFNETHLNMWIKDLETIIKACENKAECSWTAVE